MVEDAFGHVSICNTVLSSSVHLTGKSSKGLGLQCPGANIAKHCQVLQSIAKHCKCRAQMPWGKHCQVLPSITKYCLALQEECRAQMPGGRHCQADELSGDLGSATHEAPTLHIPSLTHHNHHHDHDLNHHHSHHHHHHCKLSGNLGSATHEALISASFTHPFPTSKHHYHSNTSLWIFSTTV